MKQRAAGVVVSITAERSGAQEIVARLEEPASVGKSIERAALNYIPLTGRIEVGERVLLNTLAVALGLGTGGLDFVIARLDQPETELPAPGHILKLRYTPLQTSVLAVEAPESPYHEAIRAFRTLEETPVACLELHSQLPAVCAAAAWGLRECGWERSPRIVYIMTEEAALPLGLSRLVPQLKEKGLLTAVITSGQAFGGDYEAVNLYSALAAAKAVAEADLILVGQGPGNVGTETPLGFSGIEQGTAINAAGALGGIPIAVPRISFADSRDRHHGLSHHTITVLRDIALAAAFVPIPRLPSKRHHRLYEVLEETGIAEKHQPITVDAENGLKALIATGIPVTTMGREIAQDRPFFLAAAAAGLLAAQLVEARREA